MEGNNWSPSQPSLEASWAFGPDLPVWNMTSLTCQLCDFSNLGYENSRIVKFGSENNDGNRM